jgi:anti-sigma28 factor (negative regulator of flagellin synthesis)
VNVNKKRFLEVFEAAPELRKAKIAVLKKAITGGAYKVKAEDIAEKILKERLFELALTLYNHKSKG